MIERVESLAKRTDIIISVGVMLVLSIMIIPLPPVVLDLFLSLQISSSIIILVTSIFISKPLDFSAFPSILLITTLFRLALNIASTRLILLKGNEGVEAAGNVIMAFGSFVVGGNYVVGFIVFLILILINFIVITKGAGRIAEVAARFTLDALPGKQMAIDADLNAGIINDLEARKRRMEVAREADFYGAMDGASKFVRGDAIAGLVITVINILGGLIIGVLQYDMSVSDAASTFTILTIGDGLVSQIPALLISTGAGIVVSRAGVETNLGKDIAKQMLINPKALYTASVFLLVFGLIPGFPHIPFFTIAILLSTIAYIINKIPKEEEKEEVQEEKQEEPKIESYIEYDPVSLEIGYSLISLVEEGKGDLLSKIKIMRKQLASELGFIVPPIHIKDNLQLRPHEYKILIRGVEIAGGELMVGYYLAIESDESVRSEIEIKGIPTKEPTFGMKAYWIEEAEIDRAKLAGYTIVDPASVLVTHLTEIMKSHGWELLTRTEVQNLLDKVAKVHPKLVDELIPVHLTLGNLQRIFQNLLRERVPINDLVTILETLLDYSPQVKDVEILTEFVRQALSRYITKQYMDSNGNLAVLTLDPVFERQLAEANEQSGVLNPDVISKLLKSFEKALVNGREKLLHPIILCSSQNRRYLRKIVERFLPSVVVLSNAEISHGVKLISVGMIAYED